MMSTFVVMFTTHLFLAGADWPSFRGDGASRSTSANLPTTWSETDNIAWSIDLPGYGQSSPIVWKESVYVTSSEGEMKDKLVLSSFDLKTGKQKWRAEFPGTQKVKESDMVSRSAPTPAVDADRVYAFYESGDLIAVDHAGEEVWKRSFTGDYGDFTGNHGIGSSIAQSKDAIFVLVDHEGPSYLLAVDKKTGQNVWKADRQSRVSWSSPVVVEWKGRPLVIVSSAGLIDAYDAATGERLWWLEGLKGNTVPSPSPAGELVVFGSSDVSSNLAIRLGGSGDISASNVVWKASKATSSFGSPLVYEENVYFVNRAGVGYCVALADGTVKWDERIGSCWASPIGAEGRIYFFTKDGKTIVCKAGDKFEKIAENTLPTDDRVYGVAAVNGAFIIRTGRKLIGISKP